MLNSDVINNTINNNNQLPEHFLLNPPSYHTSCIPQAFLLLSGLSLSAGLYHAFTFGAFPIVYAAVVICTLITAVAIQCKVIYQNKTDRIKYSERIQIKDNLDSNQAISFKHLQTQFNKGIINKEELAVAFNYSARRDLAQLTYKQFITRHSLTSLQALNSEGRAYLKLKYLENLELTSCSDLEVNKLLMVSEQDLQKVQNKIVWPPARVNRFIAENIEYCIFGNLPWGEINTVLENWKDLQDNNLIPTATLSEIAQAKKTYESAKENLRLATENAEQAEKEAVTNGWMSTATSAAGKKMDLENRINTSPPQTKPKLEKQLMQANHRLETTQYHLNELEKLRNEKAAAASRLDAIKAEIVQSFSSR